MGSARRDAYSLLLFDSGVSYGIVNDVASSPDELLRIMLRYEAGGGTSFNRALDGAVDLDHIDRQSDPAPWIAEALADGLDLDGVEGDERRLTNPLVPHVLLIAAG